MPKHATQAAAPRVFATLADLRVAGEHLCRADPRLRPLLEAHGLPERLLAKSSSAFVSLSKSIVFQQLAGTAAAAIYGRFLGACQVETEAQLTPRAVLAAPMAGLQACGLSQRKAEYMRSLAQHFEDGQLSDAMLQSLPAAELMARLTAVRGIGPWTVHMFEIFFLGSTDVLPTGDLGVRKGLAEVCKLKSLPSPAEMERVTSAWQPYRSLGCYYMWRVPVPRAGSKGAGGKKASGVPAAPLGAPLPAVADVGVSPSQPFPATAAVASSTAAGAAVAAAVSVAAASSGAGSPELLSPVQPAAAAAAPGRSSMPRSSVATRRRLHLSQESAAAAVAAAPAAAPAGPGKACSTQP